MNEAEKKAKWIKDREFETQGNANPVNAVAM